MREFYKRAGVTGVSAFMESYPSEVELSLLIIDLGDCTIIKLEHGTKADIILGGVTYEVRPKTIQTVQLHSFEAVDRILGPIRIPFEFRGHWPDVIEDKPSSDGTSQSRTRDQD